ncbi:hypothetical protein [Silvimonas iriomotensis]|uniref:Type 4 fimbrial biogenesis protein PilX N-terminal domain-containing protein n=1 Tax=Silvimonas iriomotensis TaxID=449662 RepID=A0ABQ2P945_9NEIS|nr:hypothetical protein [Silvimonas iriomotensis]GGP21082.1 hypothetical protein GCM10010970_18630 [Silvimonas iriomotensis]
MMIHHATQPFLPSRQRGLAAILLVMLVGLSLTVTVLGTMHYVRAEQDSALTTHAVTTAQMKAWDGVEAFRQYLNALGQTQAAALPTSAPGNVVSISGGSVASGISGVVTAVNTGAASCSSGTQVTASFTGNNAAASDIKAAATVEAVYCVTTSGSGTTTPPGNVSGGMVIYGNLNTSGNIKFAGDASANMTVVGNLTDSGTLDGVNNLYTTGSVNLSSTGTVQNILAQGDVTIGNSASFQSVSSQGNVTITNNATITTINANGSVTFRNSSTVGTVNALAGATANGQPSTTTVGSGGVTTAGAQTITNVNTNGTLNLNNATVKNLAAAGSLNFQDNYSAVKAGTVGTGFLPTGKTGTTNSSNVTFLQGFMPTYAANTVPVPGVTVPPPPTIDAWANRNLANYAFDVDSNNFIRVNIADVNGVSVNSGAAATTSVSGTAIPAGAWYVLGSGANQDMLCPTSTYSAGSCTIRVCYSGSQYNSCFGTPSVSGAVPTWSVNGVGSSEPLPPGIVWFNGNVNLGLGTWFNTVMATGNITTSANNVTYAPNYVGYGNVANPNPNAKIGTAGICVNNPFNSATAMTSNYPSQNLYPTNLCPTPPAPNCVPSAGNNYCGYKGAANPMANIALYAGGYMPPGTTFSGGTVTLGASTTIFGNVISADTVSFGGSTYVAGYVNAFQQSQSNASSFAASTTIDLTNYPPTFNPCVAQAGCNSGSGGAGVTTTTVMWTRYK